jgi:diketogulonate reductase-like aldo/keto reductase
MANIAQDIGCSVAQALYRFTQMEGIVPLSGTTNEKHMKDDVNVERIDLSSKKKLVEEVRSFVGL